MDFEKFKTEFLNEINKTIDTRFSGFQSIIDRRDKNVESKWKAYDETLKELKSRTLSDEEREQLEQRAEAEEFAALKAENELLKLGKEQERQVSPQHRPQTSRHRLPHREMLIQTTRQPMIQWMDRIGKDSLRRTLL